MWKNLAQNMYLFFLFINVFFLRDDIVECVMIVWISMI